MNNLISKLKSVLEAFSKAEGMKALSAIYRALVLSVAALCIASILPASIGDLKTHDAADSFNLFIYTWRYVLLIVFVLAITSKRIRGSLKYLFQSEDSVNAAQYLTAALIMLAAINLPKLFAGPFAHPARLNYFATLFVALGFVWLLYYYLRSRPKAPAPGALRPDNATITRNDVSGDQTIVLNTLIRLIATDTGIRSLGLFGAWGSGKSAVIEVARAELSKSKPEIIWVDFEPWKYTSQESLTLGFYETIGAAIEKSIPGAHNAARELLDLSEPLVKKHDSTGIFEFLIGGIRKFYKSKFSKPEQYIKQILEVEERRIVLLIDDVERMFESEHIFRTLQLAHFLKTSKRIMYIFVAEKEKLLASTPDRYKDEAGIFLEKFIEHEIYMPLPQRDELRAFLNQLLEEKRAFIPLDFTLSVSNELIEDAATYRGVLRTFNKFIDELKTRFYSEETQTYTINLEDKYKLDHISIKYPLLWQHIQQERDLYVGRLNDTEWAMRHGFADESELQKKAKEIMDKLLESLHLSPERLELVNGLLHELFPDIGRKNAASRHPETSLRDRHVSHPDVLDLYFASSAPLEVYTADLKKATDLIRNLTGTDLASRLDAFEEYIQLDDLTRSVDRIYLLKRELGKLNNPAFKKEFLHTLLRAYLRSTRGAQHIEDSRLARILSFIDETAADLRNDTQALNEFLDYVFRDVEADAPHPAELLRLALFMLPERGNSYISYPSWANREALRERILTYVDDYYLNHVAENTLFGGNARLDWRFVFYQWTLGVSTTSKVPTTPEALARKSNANQYLFGIFTADHRLAYTSIHDAFRVRDEAVDPMGAWHVTHESLIPYDTDLFKQLLEQMKVSARLNNEEKEKISSLLEKVTALTQPRPTEPSDYTAQA
jgi:hypothetical protein